MKGFIVAFIIWLPSLFLAGLSGYAQSHINQWYPAKETSTHTFKPVMLQQDIEVFSAPSLIKIAVNQTVNVKIFTILGKLISSQNLEPGTYEYNLSPSGIYIIKTPETTCKVAI